MPAATHLSKRSCESTLSMHPDRAQAERKRNEADRHLSDVQVLGKGECEKDCCPSGFFCCDGPGGKCALDNTLPPCGIVADCCPPADS